MQITIIDPAPRFSDPNIRILRSWGACPEQCQLTARDLRRCRAICDLVIAEYLISGRDLFHRRRTARIALPRQVAMSLMRRVLHLPLQAIGRLFDRDHGTVIWATKAIDSHTASSSEFAASWSTLCSRACHIATH
jgi:chromosomal replication initiation ATPase DnaA